MNPELCKMYPLFGGLVARLNEKLSSQGASPRVQKVYDQEQRNLTKARSEYLTNKILHDEIEEVLTDLEVRGRDHSLSSDEDKLRDVLSTALAYAALPDYLHFSPCSPSSSTLFGLSEDDVDRHNPVKAHLPDLLQVVAPRVEEKLGQKCEDLFAYFDPQTSQTTTSERLLAAKAHSLPALVEERKTLLARETTHLQDVRLRRDRQFWSYFQKLLECLSIMETLIKEYKCGSQAQTDRITVDHLWAMSKATCLKVRSAQLHILGDTYTAETVKALKIVSGHLGTATEQAKRELSASTQSLHAYRRLGPEFSAVAAEMAQLQQELENKTWGLRQFGVQHGSPGGHVGEPRTDGAAVTSRSRDTEVRSSASGELSLRLGESGMLSSLNASNAQSKTASLPDWEDPTGSKTRAKSHQTDASKTSSDIGNDAGTHAKHSGSSSTSDVLSEAVDALNISNSQESHQPHQSRSHSQAGKRVTFQQDQ